MSQKYLLSVKEVEVEDQIYTYHAEMCKAFSHPKRLELINVLGEKEIGASEHPGQFPNFCLKRSSVFWL
jgi:hypothetical protein